MPSAMPPPQVPRKHGNHIDWSRISGKLQLYLLTVVTNFFLEILADANGRYACPRKCGRTFAKKGGTKQHHKKDVRCTTVPIAISRMKPIAARRNVICSCGVRFVSTQGLISHKQKGHCGKVQTFHGIHPTQYINCNLCSQRFAYKYEKAKETAKKRFRDHWHEHHSKLYRYQSVAKLKGEYWDAKDYNEQIGKTLAQVARGNVRCIKATSGPRQEL